MDYITHNLSIICPTTYHSKFKFDLSNPSIILYKKGDFFEPLFYAKKKTTKKLTIIEPSEYNFLFNIKDSFIQKTLQFINAHLGQCKEININKKYNFKQNKSLQEIQSLLPTEYSIKSQVIAFDFTIIGAIIKNGDFEFFIPCRPGNLTQEIEVIRIDEVVWHTYDETVKSLIELYQKSNKQIYCRPVIRVLEDTMIVGVLTMTNQFIQLNEPEQDEYDGKDRYGLNKIEEHNYINDDYDITHESVSYYKNKTIHKLKLEKKFYNAYFNILKIEINKFENIAIRHRIEEIFKESMLYSEKIQEIKELLVKLIESKIRFITYSDAVLSEMEDINLCKEGIESNYCSPEGYLLIPTLNLYTNTPNEDLYLMKFIDGILRNHNIKTSVFEHSHSTIYFTDKYNLTEDEILMLESLLIPYLEKLGKTVYSNDRVTYLSFEDLQPEEILNLVDISEIETQYQSPEIEETEETEGSKKEPTIVNDADEEPNYVDTSSIVGNITNEDPNYVDPLDRVDDSEIDNSDIDDSDVDDSDVDDSDVDDSDVDDADADDADHLDEYDSNEKAPPLIPEDIDYEIPNNIVSESSPFNENKIDLNEKSDSEINDNASEDAQLDLTFAPPKSKIVSKTKNNNEENSEYENNNGSEDAQLDLTFAPKSKIISNNWKDVGSPFAPKANNNWKDVGSPFAPKANNNWKDVGSPFSPKEDEEDDDEEEEFDLSFTPKRSKIVPKKVPKPEEVEEDDEANTEEEEFDLSFTPKRSKIVAKKVPKPEEVEEDDEANNEEEEFDLSFTPKRSKIVPKTNNWEDVGSPFAPRSKLTLKKPTSTSVDVADTSVAASELPISRFKSKEMLKCIDRGIDVADYPTEKWKKLLPKKTKRFRIRLSDDFSCNFLLLIYILKDFDKRYSGYKIADIKRMLIVSYQKLYKQKEAILQKWTKEYKMNFVKLIKKRKATFESIILSPDYFITTIDIVLLMRFYEIPIVLLYQQKGKSTTLSMKNEKDYYYFIKVKTKKQFFLHYIDTKLLKTFRFAQDELSQPMLNEIEPIRLSEYFETKRL